MGEEKKDQGEEGKKKRRTWNTTREKEGKESKKDPMMIQRTLRYSR